MAKFNVTGEQDLDIDKKMTEIKRQLRQKGGSSIDPEKLSRVLQEIIEGKFTKEDLRLNKALLRLLSRKDPTVIDPCTGSESAENHKNFFKTVDYHDGRVFSTKATEKTRVVFMDVKTSKINKEISGNRNIWSGRDLRESCFTESQAVSFCLKYLMGEQEDSFTLRFLIDTGHHCPQMMQVNVYTDGLCVHFRNYDEDAYWEGNQDCYVVLPA